MMLMRKTTMVLVAAAAVLSLTACGQGPAPAAQKADRTEPKVGVLLANHGSREKGWRDMLLDVEKAVDRRLLALPNIAGVKSAFMEYTEPSIATRLKEFDAEGYDQVIVVPLFITVGAHTNEDIPHLIGLKNNPNELEKLRKEGIEVYKPRARVTLTPTIDATHFLTENILRRTQALLQDDDGRDFGVTLIAYGDHLFNEQWEQLMDSVGRRLMEATDIDMVNYAWSGHLVHYSIEPTRKAVNQILAEKKGAIVVSIYVAYAKMFQTDVHAEGIRQSDRPEAVRYAEREAILPDGNLNDWIVASVDEVLSIRHLATSN